MIPDFLLELKQIINRYSQENASNTPDFILAQYLNSCLSAFNVAVQQRETWYGRDARPSCSIQEMKAVDAWADKLSHDCEAEVLEPPAEDKEGK